MVINKHGAYVCPSCKGVFVGDTDIRSMFGVT
jgi:hypothetical protein